MLKIKYFTEFDGPITQLLILGRHEDYAHASNYLTNKDEVYLNDPNIAIYYDSKIIIHSALYLNKIECSELAKMFKKFGSNRGNYHNYYNTKALNEYKIEIKISVGEYSDQILVE